MNLFSPVVGVDDMSRCNRCNIEKHPDELKFNFGVCDGCDQHKEELELEPCWSCNKIVVNEENAHSAVDEGDYIAFVCAKCGEEE